MADRHSSYGILGYKQTISTVHKIISPGKCGKEFFSKNH